MYMIYKFKSVLKYEERQVRRKGIFHAPDFLLVPMNHHVHIEMLGVRIKAHMEAILSMFGPNVAVGFNRKSCLQIEGARVHTFITHGDNGKMIGLLKENQEESDHIMMGHYTRDVGIDFIYELQYEELKILVRYRSFTANASGESITCHSLLYSNLNDEVIINQDTNDTDTI